MPTATASRQIKAIQIVTNNTNLTHQGRVWNVPSQSGSNSYRVYDDPQTPFCTCPDFERRQARCKHIYAVEYYQLREQMIAKKGNR